MNPTRLYLAFVIGSLLIAAPGSSPAANKYYDPSKTTGNWTDSSWGTVQAGPYNTGWVNGDTALFYPTSLSLDLTVNPGVSAQYASFFGPAVGTSSLTLGGSTLTLTGGDNNNRSFYIQRNTAFNNNTTIVLAKGAYLGTITDGSNIGTIKLTGNSIFEMNNNFSKTINGISLNNQGHTLELQVSDRWLYNFPIQGSGQVIFNANANNLHSAAFSGNNTFTGGLRIKAGELYLQSAGALNSTTPNAVSFDTGTANKLSLNGLNVAVAGLSGGDANSEVRNDVRAPYGTRGTINNAAATLTINNSGNYTFGGNILNGDAGAQALSIIKTGNGMQTLAGANTYTGTTTVNGGILNVSGTHSGNGNVTVNDGGTFQIGAGGTYSGNGTFTVNDGGTMRVNGTHTGTGNVTVNSGGTFGGTGNFGKLVTINTGAFLAPGASPGVLTVTDLTLQDGATVNFEPGDRTDVTNTLTLPNEDWILALTGNQATWALGGYTVVFNYGSLSGTSWAGEQTTVPLDFSGITGFASGAFDDVYLFNDTENSRILLMGMYVIPEAETSTLLLGGILALLAFRRLRHA